MSQRISIPCTSTKSTDTYPKSDFTFGIDTNGNQILVANPLSATMSAINGNPNKMPYNLTIIVGIDADYNGNPNLYYDDSLSAFIVEFDYQHTVVPNTLHQWTITVENGDGRILKGLHQPKVYLSDTYQTSSEIIINGDGTETSKGTEVVFDEPPMGGK
ncbi:hypothetical protein [Tenacibaculum ovolyticum]|uniref:hypothetical protein n=1 Tax=Tenacibaculum ovolyticum TaxID=104270 RepID=UPI003BAB8393